jgi:hypothetical protein
MIWRHFPWAASREPANCMLRQRDKCEAAPLVKENRPSTGRWFQETAISWRRCRVGGCHRRAARKMRQPDAATREVPVSGACRLGGLTRAALKLANGMGSARAQLLPPTGETHSSPASRELRNPARKEPPSSRRAAPSTLSSPAAPAGQSPEAPAGHESAH